MKKTWLVGGVLVFAVVIMAIIAALQTGEKSPAFATGRVVLDPSLEDKAKDIRTLFIVIHDADSPMPMPYGAIKENLSEGAKAGTLVDFLITKERVQAMGGGMDRPLPKNMRLKARLDLDGLGGMDQPGDLIGVVEGVPFGAENVEIKINQAVP